jgi:hypothetical protein
MSRILLGVINHVALGLRAKHHVALDLKVKHHVALFLRVKLPRSPFS